jgi:DNA polymerase-3 subunit gamma/tau
VSIDTVLGTLRQLRGEAGGNAAAAMPVPVVTPVPAGAPAAGQARTAALSASAAPVPAPATVTPGPAAAAGPAARTGGDVDLTGLWTSLVDAVGRASAFTRTYFIEAHPVSLTEGVLTIGFDPEFAEHIDLVNNAKTHTLLQTKLQELGHAGTQIKFIKAERPSGWAPATPAPAGNAPAPSPASARGGAAKSAEPKRDKPAGAPVNLEEFKNDPLIRQALEVFKGHIIEVRA